MMGSRSLPPLYKINPATSDAERLSEPEEYILDTYTLPVDADLNKPSAGSLSFPLRNLSIGDPPSSRLHQKKHHFVALKHKTHRKSFPLEDIYTRAPAAGGGGGGAGGVFRSPVEPPPPTLLEGEACSRKTCTGRDCPTYHKLPSNPTRQAVKATNHKEDRSRGSSGEEAAAAAAAAAAFQDCIGILHDDPIVCSCCACHVLVKKGCERQNRAREPRSGLVGTTMGDLDGLGVGKGGRSGRRAGHQPPFLKTVSIIDTLSELGPEVRHLAEEPSRPSASTSSSARPPRNTTTKVAPPVITSSSSSSSSSSCPLTESKDINHSLGPPLVSADFQQYTEEIYDAVTRRSGHVSSASSSSVVPSSTRLKNHRSKLLPSNINPERLKNHSTSQNRHRDANEENGFKVRLGEESISRRHHYSDQRGRERGRTPDWIKKIFDISKKGDIDAVKQGIAGMEETLVRNLSDHAGNNLLHVMAVFGHLAPMAWMLTTHSVLVDALHDENKFGLTPLVCSIKYGRLQLVQWLVENTVIKDKVKCKDGERSLLHIAAKYAQEEIVAWLVEYVMTHEISLDNKDHHGNTALHLAARTGNSRLCSILLQHGADVTLKNDLGQKAWEVCVIRGHVACAEYLCVHESGLALATDLTKREAELEAAMADNHDLRINFKEVMSIARRLLREREEAVRELSKLHEQMIEAHDNILALHAYGGAGTLAAPAANRGGAAEGNAHQHHSRRDDVKSVVTYMTKLHERWQSVQRTWFGSSLVTMKHKMLLVEEAWKKLRHRSHRTVATTHHPLDVFRGKLCAVRAQGGEGRLGDLPSLCSSEESLVSLFPFTDDDEIYDKEDNYEALPSSTPARRTNTSKSRFQSTEVLQESINCARHDVKSSCFNDVSAITDTKFNETLSPRIRNEDSLPEKKEVESLLSRPSISPSKSTKLGESSSRPYWTDPSLSASLSLITELSPGEQLPKEEINARLKELALTSESGSCSVLEVIEPSSEESDTHADEEKPAELSLGATQLCEDNIIKSKSRNISDRREKRSVRLRHDDAEVSGGRGEATTSSESGADCVTSLEKLHTNDISSHVNSEGKHFLVNETSVGTAAVDVSDKSQRPQENRESQESFLGLSTSIGVVVTTAAPPPTIAFKRKGFLHKLIKPSRWPSKRKVKALRKIDPGNTREFLEPYPHRVESRSINYNIGEVDPHTTPESNTSSSQEYSNSSEESSIGKPTSASSSRPTELFQSYSGHTDSETRHNILSSNTPQVIEKTSEKSLPHMIPHSAMISPPSSSSPPPPLPSRRAILSPTLSDTSFNTQSYHSDDRSISVKNLDNIQKISVTEVRSVATSEDSGIVARPASSASKSDSVSRPESSSSSFPPFKNDYNLQKMNLSLTQDMLPTPDSSTAGRMSPAPSEVSKTESALSPPSHASDISKSESSRQTSMGKGSLGSSTHSESSKDGSAVSSDYSVTLLPLKKDLNVKTAAIINISCDQKSKQTLQDELSDSTGGDLPCSKKERPWYELSDEESDILLPDRLTSKGVSRHSSSEDETEIC